MDVQSIKISEIVADSEFNCRGEISAITVTELARDIKERGLLQPIIVCRLKEERADGRKYKVIAGHRRLKAHQVNGAETIEASIRSDINETEALIINIGENLQRQQLTILQEAKAIHKIVVILGPAMTAKRLNQSITWVNIRIQLLELPYDIQLEAEAGLLTQKQVTAIWRMKTDEERFAAVKKIKKAKDSGEKVPDVALVSELASNAKRVRGKQEITMMQTHIRSIIGNGLATRLLAWVGGEITDAEVFETIRATVGSRYVPPEHSLMTLAHKE